MDTQHGCATQGRPICKVKPMPTSRNNWLEQEPKHTNPEEDVIFNIGSQTYSGRAK